MLTSINCFKYYQLIVVGIVAQIALGYEWWLAWFGKGLSPDVYNTEKRRKVGMCVARTACISIVLPFLILNAVWILFPSMQDIPEYLAESYSVTEGTVSRVLRGSNSLEVSSNATGKILEFRYLSDIEGIEEGDYVEISHLKHIRIGAVTEVNRQERSVRRHMGKAFLSWLFILGNVFLIIYTLMVMGRIENPQGKKYGTKVYLRIYTKLLLVLDVVMVTGAFMALFAIGKGYNQAVAVVWNCLLLCCLILSWVLLGLTQQKIVIKGKDITYIHFTTCYKGKTEDIIKLELNDKNQLVIIMKDGTKLVVNDREMFKNQEFYHRLKRELPEAVTGGAETVQP